MDHTALIQSISDYAAASTTPAELAEKLQVIDGGWIDRIFTAIEILYAFRDLIQSDGLTVLGQLTSFANTNGWDFPDQVGRMQAIDKSTQGALGQLILASNFQQPDPIVAYRNDGRDWRQPIDLDTVKTRRRNEVDTLLAVHFQIGFTPSTGPIAGKTLQVRDLDDRTNWLTSQAAYLAAVSGGQGATVGAAFRTADNSTITCSYSDGLNTLLAMADWGKQLFGKSWTLKDQITAATDADSVNAIDITSGWPGDPAPATPPATTTTSSAAQS